MIKHFIINKNEKISFIITDKRAVCGLHAEKMGVDIRQNL